MALASQRLNFQADHSTSTWSAATPHHTLRTIFACALRHWSRSDRRERLGLPPQQLKTHEAQHQTLNGSASGHQPGGDVACRAVWRILREMIPPMMVMTRLRECADGAPRPHLQQTARGTVRGGPLASASRLALALRGDEVRTLVARAERRIVAAGTGPLATSRKTKIAAAGIDRAAAIGPLSDRRWRCSRRRCAPARRIARAPPFVRAHRDFA